jgi:SHS2 domain-containing protein
MAAAHGYELFEHTADVGVRAWGATPGDAFVEAAFGMAAVTLGEDPRSAVGLRADGARRRVAVAGAGWEAVLVRWLGEFIALFDAEGLLPRLIEMRVCEPWRCEAEVEPAALAPDAETAGVGVKAVTYHQLRVDVQPEHTQISVILDI